MPTKKKEQKKSTAVKIKTRPKKAPNLATLVKSNTEEILKKLGFQTSAKVSPLENGGFSVQIECAEPNFLIGYHGQTLSALQLITSLSVQKETGTWTPIVLNVGDYRERREEQLRHLALSIAQRVRFSGQLQTIGRLTAAERRIVHLTLAGDEMVESFSEGEGSDRHLVVRLKQTH